ncbi:MAG: TIGR00282 family metallophosphoesterase [Alphaproteobacteria bacterium]|nr:TIGR00282 family metallophosphoesterase [Alphaproteobacteria bacterium]
MRILFLGDVVGRSGRKQLLSNIDNIVSKLKIDFTIVNAENSAHGFGINPSVSEKFFNHQIDVLTTGDHIWDQMTIKPYLQEETRILRPANYNKYNDGIGARVYTSKNGKKILVVNLLGTLFIERENLDNPFITITEILKKYKLGVDVDAIFIDMHAEATSEKMSLANYVDGKVSAVVGTHTHIPTSDAHILPQGTAFQTDAGMCGDYDSSIGMKKQASIDRFFDSTIRNHLEPSEGEATICGVIIETDDKTGLAKTIEPLRIGGILQQTHKL